MDVETQLGFGRKNNNGRTAGSGDIYESHLRIVGISFGINPEVDLTIHGVLGEKYELYAFISQITNANPTS